MKTRSIPGLTCCVRGFLPGLFTYRIYTIPGVRIIPGRAVTVCVDGRLPGLVPYQIWIYTGYTGWVIPDLAVTVAECIPGLVLYGSRTIPGVGLYRVERHSLDCVAGCKHTGLWCWWIHTEHVLLQYRIILRDVTLTCPASIPNWKRDDLMMMI